MEVVFLNRLTARWWFRIIIFLPFLMLFNYIQKFIPVPAELSLLLFALILTLAIEYSRVFSSLKLCGLIFNKRFLPDVTFGMLLPLAGFTLFLVLGLMSGNLHSATFPGFYVLLQYSTLIFIMAITEELIFTGVMFQAMLSRFSALTSVLVFSLFFGASHLFNTGINAFSFTNILLANVLLSLMYLRTRSLWMPISFHFFWNWGQAVILGSSVSGFHYGISLLKINTLNSSFLFGGQFGIEGGIITTLLLIAFIPVVLKFAKIDPFLPAMHLKRDYYESLVLEKNLL